MNQGNAPFGRGGNSEESSFPRMSQVNRYRRASSRRHPPPPSVRLQPLTIVNEGGNASSSLPQPPLKQPPLQIVTTSRYVPPVQSGKPPALPTTNLKRRKDTSPVALVHMEPPPNATSDHQTPHSNRTLVQVHSFLDSLLDSCRKHIAMANHTHAAEDEEEFSDPISNPLCREAIHALQRILPHVEEGLGQVVAPAPSVIPDPSVESLISRMCELYRDILQGRFCPQAPHLLLHTTDLIPRIYLLFQCLAYQSASFHSRTTADEYEQILSSGTQICNTMAQLINQLPDTRLLRAIIRDLIYLSKDLSLWFVFTTTRDKKDSDIAELHVSLMEETIHTMDWPDAKTREYYIDIPNTRHAIQAMQWYSFSVLQRLLVIRQQQRLNPNVISGIVEDYDDHYISLGGDADLYLIQYLDANELRILLLSLRQSLLTASSSDSISDLVLPCLVQNAASRVLMLLQSDWHRSFVPSVSLLQEVALLLGHSIQYCLTLESQILTALPTASWLLDVLKGTLDSMAQLLSTLIYKPPNVSGSMSRCDVVGRIHQLLWPILCESILSIKGNGSAVKERCSLDVVLLRTVLAIARGLLPHACRSLPNTDVVQHLLFLTNDPLYMDSVLFILSSLLFQSTNPQSIVLGLEDVMKLSNLTRAMLRAENSTMPSAAIGFKRKLPYSTYNPEKRVKNERMGIFGRTSLSYYDDLVAFFNTAQEGISRLISVLKHWHEGSNEASVSKASFDAIVSDVVLLTSRLRLVLLLIETHEIVGSNVSSVAPFLCGYIKDSFAALSLVVDVCLKEYSSIRFDPVTRRVVELIIMCALHIEKTTCLDGSALVDARGICRSVYILAKGLNVATVHDEGFVIGLPFQFPASFHDTIFGLVLKGLPPSEFEWTTIPPILDVGILGISVTIDMSKLYCFTVIWTGPIFKPIYKDVTAQIMRLDLLSTSPGPVVNATGTKQEIVQQSIVALREYAHVKHSSSLHRLLLWQTCAWIFTSMTPNDLRQSFGPSNADGVFGTSVLHFLVDIALSDQEPFVREYASRELGDVLSSNDWASLLSLLASDSEWQHLKCSENEYMSREASSKEVVDQVLCRFFQGIDDIVHELLSKSEFQTNYEVMEGSRDVTGFRRSSARTFCSLCLNRNSSIGAETVIIQHAIVRIVQLWTRFDDVVYSAICLAEVSLLSRRADMGLQFRDDYWPAIAPYLLQDVLVSNSSFSRGAGLNAVGNVSNSLRELQFRNISAFIRATTIYDSSDYETSQLSLTNESDLERIFELWLPFIVSRLVADKNHDALQFSMSYRLYLRGRHRADLRHRKRNGPFNLESDLICGYFIGDISKIVPSRQWNRDLDNATREFCLEPGLVEQIIPLIFTKSGIDGIHFFMKKVLQDKVTIQQLVKSREMFTLKYFVLEFGRDPGSTELVVAALKKAAVIRQNNAREVDIQSLYDQDAIVCRDAVGNWVSTHFMYLLVNVVQSKWTSKTIAQQISSLRCLLPVLEYLHSPESAQYLPHVLATVNAALSDCSSALGSIQDRALVAQLKLIAVLFLSKFVKVIAETQVEFLGQNLTSIVVSLVPILSTTHTTLETPGFESEYQRHGVALLEWLSRKEILLSYFAEIPFLPSTSALDSVRATLRSRGINFDNLQTVTTQGTQDASRRAVASDCGSTEGDSRGGAIDASRQGALRHRLETICPLLENESVSVRRVVLQHITGLLRANRELFHALLENEGSASLKQFLTVTYGDKNGFRWSLTNFIELLLSRCTKEGDPETRALLATCFGEVGAINANRFDDMQSFFGSRLKHIIDPPWHSAPHQFQLQLVTTYLVVALKAAPATNDQHKIAFAIQQLLDLLNDAGSEGLLLSSCDDVLNQGGSSKFKITISANDSDILQKPKMNESLIFRLTEAQVLDVVEPFWTSDFHETVSTRPKTPPFFRKSTTFYDWLSMWCRYMVHCAYDSRKTAWTRMFHCCRTALRTQAGLGIAELLLPFLVLDRLCFGSGQEHMLLLNEIRDVLMYCDNEDFRSGITMTSSEIRNAVSTIFSLLDTLQHWVEPEVESKYCKKSRSPGKDAQLPSYAPSCDWQRSESAMRIEDLLSKVPLELRGRAACKVGMYATALRFLELASRSAVVDVVFGIDANVVSQPKPNRSRAAGLCPEGIVDLLKDVLASLDDYETIEALVSDYNWVAPEVQTKDSIRQKESKQDWQGALHEYERAQQQNVDDSSIRLGTLRCLLQLGHFDGVLQHVNYMQYKATLDKKSQDDFTEAVPIAVEAACRLGRWEALSELVEEEPSHSVKAVSSDSLYQVHCGKALLQVKRKSLDGVLGSLNRARLAVMDSLSSVARESYSRSYDHLVRLQALREIEDVAEELCSSNSSYLPRLMQDNTIAWNRRLDLVSSSGATTIMNVRLVLARLANDSAYEGSLFLRMGKRARKSGLLSAAANSFSLAEAAFRCVDENQKATWKSAVVLQCAKLNHSAGESSIALRMLGHDDIESMGMLKDQELVTASCQRVVQNLGIEKHEMNEKEILGIFVQSALQSTRWMIEGGLKEAAEIVARFRVIHSVAPSFEKGHFHFAKYIDSLLQSRILALQGRYAVHFTGTDDEQLRNHIISRDKACIRYVVLAIKHFAEALILDVKHVYQVLPRLLSLWFDFTGIAKQNGKENIRSGLPEGGLELDSLLNSCQDEVNKFMAASFKKISAQALYTSIPQLISRITHDDNDTAAIVQAMLRRVLIKYPAQAMWPLGWIRQSRDPQRQQIGVDIFHQATEALNKRESLHRLLITSKTLLDYLYALAKKDVGDKVKDSMKVRPLSDEVNLSEFVPPIQAALSASLASGDTSRSRDVFPRHIPRMRSIDETVGVMASKARPKKIKVYVVAADSVTQLRKGNSDCFDIGEIHFLLKQEAKGDLRKDARVQDLNNVVNRIMSSMDHNKGLKSQSRRLHLRTFCVTCLSEDTGLLEWVPHTASLRSMISKTYNPQANSVHGKRHGKRITNFNDPNLRVKFESVCQAAYFVSGNLTKAAALFENECLSKYPPVLYWWYVLQFPDPHAWYEARTRFALSTAAWSAVGHVIGLGDRHSENILLDKTSGECVHVDFDCIFDKGLYLPKPEVVPFRLTQNMVDALGPTGADGVYTWNLKAAMSALRNNRDTLLSVLEPFVKDPVINWKRYRSQQRGSHRTTDHDPMMEAKQKMSVIDERLRGIYNLRNPNLKKIRRTDHLESQQDDELSHPIPLSVEGQVHKLIAEATSIENLVQLYVGWMPWV